MGINENRAVVLLSGGLDSTTVLALTIAQGYRICALTFDYKQIHANELLSVKKIINRYQDHILDHKVVTIDLSIFGGSSLTQLCKESKSLLSESIRKGIPSTYVPARNTIFLSYALCYAETMLARRIFIGVNAVDYSGYPDCRPEFIDKFTELANLATAMGVNADTGDEIKIEAPLQYMNKAQIIKLGLDNNVDYGLTSTCYTPDVIGRPCGYCDACKFRLEGFAQNEINDPLEYI